MQVSARRSRLDLALDDSQRVSERTIAERRAVDISLDEEIIDRKGGAEWGE